MADCAYCETQSRIVPFFIVLLIQSKIIQEHDRYKKTVPFNERYSFYFKDNLILLYSHYDPRFLLRQL